MSFLEFVLPDFTAVNPRIELRVRRLQQFDSPLKRIRDDFYAVEKTWFDSEGGGQWRPLSPRYAAWKERHYPGRPILQRSQLLYREASGSNPSYLLRGALLQIFIRNSPFWKLHQQGTRKMPARPVLSPLIKTRSEVWHRWVTEWISAQSSE